MSESEERLVEGRREKHRASIDAGGYPHRFDRTHLASELHDAYADIEPGTETDDIVTVAGRLMLHRSFGRLQFGTLQDMSGSIQLFVDTATAGEDVVASFGQLDLGDWVGATGSVMATKRGELSVRVGKLTLLQKALRPLPDKWHGLVDTETRSRRRYVDLMVNPEARQVASTRAKVVSELRRQFEDRGFVEVETPVLLHQATGATARPFRTHHNTLGMDMYLRIATELFLKRLVVGGMERVFEIGRIFRNEGIDSTHNPEFTMLEAYQAFADYTDIMALIEEVIGAVAVAVTGSTVISYQGTEIDLAPSYRRATVFELVSEVVGEPVDLDTDPGYLLDFARHRGLEIEEGWSSGRLIYELYEELVEPSLVEPTFATHPPAEVSPLSRRNPGDPRIADRFELVIAGAEYANAFSELNDPDDQRQRFEEQAAARTGGDEEAHPVDLDYIEALEYGLPPTGGLGIGVDRLVMLLTDQPHIREVILFPTLRPRS
ncbi:MAG TPA: lysine--tRNA ligase [Acidimicrobiia bacterium]|jgi:lysyl-tRNA synthetase class 2|nr:lysine--tRNA ligase [Acidimicrobiia bacterium]